MIIHLLRLKVSHRDRFNAVRTIQSLIGPTKARKECLTCSLYSHVDNDDELMLLQKWASQKALDNYVSSATYDLLLEGIELALEQPVVEFHKITSSSGLEYVAKTRKAMPRLVNFK